MLTLMLRRRFSENHMRIRTAEAERIHSRYPLTLRLGKRLEFRIHPHLQCFEIDVGIRILEVKIRRDLAVLEHQHRLHEACHARRGFQVTQIRLHRPDYEWRTR
jgi:hypothetical protein